MRLMFHVQFGSIPAITRQRVNHLVTFAGINEKSLKKVGVNRVMSIIMKELYIFEKAMDIIVGRKKHNLRALPILVCGDNSGQQELGGFAKNFNNFTGMISRYCVCRKGEFFCYPHPHEKFRSYNETMLVSFLISGKNKNNGLSKFFGIVESSPVVTMKHSQFPFNFGCDIAHDVLEGMMPRDIDSNIFYLKKYRILQVDVLIKKIMEIVKEFELTCYGSFKIIPGKCFTYETTDFPPKNPNKYSAGVCYVLYQIFLISVMEVLQNDEFLFFDKENVLKKNQRIQRFIHHYKLLKIVFSREVSEQSLKELDLELRFFFDLVEETKMREYFKLHNYTMYPIFIKKWGSLRNFMMLVLEVKNKQEKSTYEGGRNCIKQILENSVIMLKNGEKEEFGDKYYGVGKKIMGRDYITDQIILDKFENVGVFTFFNKYFLKETRVFTKNCMVKNAKRAIFVEKIFSPGNKSEEVGFFGCVCYFKTDDDLLVYEEVVVSENEDIMMLKDVEVVCYSRELSYKSRKRCVKFLEIDVNLLNSIINE